MTKWSKSGFLTIVGLILTLTFKPLDIKIYQFIAISNCTKVLNLVKFCQAIYEISCKQNFYRDKRTYACTDNSKT